MPPAAAAEIDLPPASINSLNVVGGSVWWFAPDEFKLPPRPPSVVRRFGTDAERGRNPERTGCPPFRRRFELIDGRPVDGICLVSGVADAERGPLWSVGIVGGEALFERTRIDGSKEVPNSRVPKRLPLLAP